MGIAGCCVGVGAVFVGVVTEVGAEVGAEVGTGIGAGVAIDAGTGVGAGVAIDAGAGAGADVATGVGAGADVAIGAGVGAGVAIGAGVGVDDGFTIFSLQVHPTVWVAERGVSLCSSQPSQTFCSNPVHALSFLHNCSHSSTVSTSFILLNVLSSPELPPSNRQHPLPFGLRSAKETPVVTGFGAQLLPSSSSLSTPFSPLQHPN